MMRGVWRDVRVAMRRLAATPLFLLFAVASLAIGLSVTVAAYALIDATIWRHTGMVSPARVAILTVPVVGPRGVTPERTWSRVLSPDDLQDLTAAQHAFSSIATFSPTNGVLVTEAASTSIRIEAVSGAYFTVAEVRPVRGRTITRIDDRERHQVVVLGESLWRRRFSAQPDIVGQSVRLDGRSFDVIGIAPAGFRGTAVGASPDAWIPLGAMAPAGLVPDEHALSLIGRLAPGRSMEAASAELQAIGQRLDSIRPHRATVGDQQPLARSWGAIGIEAQDPIGARIGWFLLLLVAIVLLVACTNLANLMLARGLFRQQELAVRRALGGSRFRLIREFVVESAIIAVLGGVAGLALTRALFVLIPQEVPTNSGAIAITPIFDLRLVVGTAAALLISLIGFGVEPALQLTHSKVSADLTTSGMMAAGPRLRRQRTLIAVQVALCTCFFAVTAIAARVALDETRHDSGIDLEHLAIAAIARQPGWDAAQIRRVAAATVQAMRSGSDVERAALTTGLPFGAPGRLARVTTPDKPIEQVVPNATNGALVMATTPGALDVLGIPLVAGRAFDARDDSASRPVAVINESAARRLFGTRQVVDREIVIQEIVGRRLAPRTLVVIGVARDTDTVSAYLRQLGAIYVPLSQVPDAPNLFLLARGHNPAAAARAVQTAIRQVAPDLGLWFVGPGSLLMAGEYVAARIAAILAIALGTIALFLAMVGLFGLQAQLAVRRTRETGIRMALGATMRQIRRLMVREGMRPVLVGVGGGLVLSVLVRLVLRVMLPVPVELLDPAALVVSASPLALAAYVACRIPASRAAHVEPSVALRQL